MGRLASQRRGQPDRQENGRHRGGYHRLQEGQRAYVTQQAAMVRRVVRFFLGGQRKGLAQQGQTHQKEDKQRPPGEPTVASRTDTIVERAYGFRLTEIRRPAAEADVKGRPQPPPTPPAPPFGVQYGCQFGVCRLAPNSSGGAMDKPAQNIQDSFLNNARKDKIVLTIYLMSGVKLSGRIKSFDKYSLVLETNNQEQLIFKHAISTVVTLKTGHSYASSSQAAVQVSATAAPASAAVAQAEAPEA